jgi:hypothetical protein
MIGRANQIFFRMKPSPFLYLLCSSDAKKNNEKAKKDRSRPRSLTGTLPALCRIPYPFPPARPSLCLLKFFLQFGAVSVGALEKRVPGFCHLAPACHSKDLRAMGQDPPSGAACVLPRGRDRSNPQLLLANGEFMLRAGCHVQN